jgi:hypothetical protein
MALEVVTDEPPVMRAPVLTDEPPPLIAAPVEVSDEPPAPRATPAAGTNVPAPPRGPRANIGARLLSLAALSGVVSGLAYAGGAGYHVLRDAFVAPIILSPDSDLVIQSKLSLGRVIAERQTVAARIEQSHAAAESARRAIAHLEELRGDAGRALDWSRVVTDKQAAAGADALARLAEQKVEVERMTAKQAAYVADVRKNVEAGLVHKAELAREENALGELRVAALQNDRDRLAAELQQRTAVMTQEALRAGPRGRRLATPEMLSQREELVHIELDLLKLQAELTEKVVQERADREELAKADELIAQMKARPIFRAVESSQNVAFVPYTQLAGVHAGDDVYACDVWGVFACHPVGRVAEVLPGEVATQDPWGTPARGQYALLTLTDPTAAQAKTLRIREPSAAPAPETRSPPSPAGPVGGPLSER